VATGEMPAEIKREQVHPENFTGVLQTVKKTPVLCPEIREVGGTKCEAQRLYAESRTRTTASFKKGEENLVRIKDLHTPSRKEESVKKGGRPRPPL